MSLENVFTLLTTAIVTAYLVMWIVEIRLRRVSVYDDRLRKDARSAIKAAQAAIAWNDNMRNPERQMDQAVYELQEMYPKETLARLRAVAGEAMTWRG